MFPTVFKPRQIQDFIQGNNVFIWSLQGVRSLLQPGSRLAKKKKALHRNISQINGVEWKQEGNQSCLKCMDEWNCGVMLRWMQQAWLRVTKTPRQAILYAFWKCIPDVQVLADDPFSSTHQPPPSIWNKQQHDKQAGRAGETQETKDETSKMDEGSQQRLGPNSLMSCH